MGVRAGVRTRSSYSMLLSFDDLQRRESDARGSRRRFRTGGFRGESWTPPDLNSRGVVDSPRSQLIYFRGLFEPSLIFFGDAGFDGCAVAGLGLASVPLDAVLTAHARFDLRHHTEAGRRDGLAALHTGPVVVSLEPFQRARELVHPVHEQLTGREQALERAGTARG